MTSSVSLRLTIGQLAAGEGDSVLVADFQPLSSAPSLSELLSARAVGRPMYLVDPLEALSHQWRYLSLSELAAGYAEAYHCVRPADDRVVVIGYCSAAALSLRIMNLLAGSQEVTGILIRPSWPGEGDVRAVFAEFLTNLGTTSRMIPDIDGDPSSCVTGVEDILRSAMASLAARQGLDESSEVFSDLLVRYRAWLAFLLACRNDPPVALDKDKTTVSVLTGARVKAAVPGLPAHSYQIRQVPILDQGDPARPEVADLVLAQIARR